MGDVTAVVGKINLLPQLLASSAPEHVMWESERVILGFSNLKFLDVLDFAYYYYYYLIWKISSIGLERTRFNTEESSAVALSLAMKAKAAATANRSIWKESPKDLQLVTVLFKEGATESQFS